MKSDFLTELTRVDNFTYTENGALAYRSTGDKLLDAFGSLGAMKDSDPSVILNTFYGAFNSNRDGAMRLLFYMRDIRGGQGLRRLFRIIIRSLAIREPELVINNLDNIIFYGRGDDYLCLFGTPVEKEVMTYMANLLNEDIHTKGYPSLLGKWLPSENASSTATKDYATQFRKFLKWSPRQYRQTLSKLRKKIGIVETLMSQNRWEEIQFDKLPSRASLIYTDAFLRHCEEGYMQYLLDAANGKAKINANVLFPVDIVHRALKSSYAVNVKQSELMLTDALWNALPNYFGDTEETGICVVDTSGSMSGIPMEVALSLGMYCADKAKGPFHNHFITFSSQPKLQNITGDHIVDKLRGMESSDWQMNTNVGAVFELILNTAINANMSQNDLPDKLYIISDMQFDECATDDDYTGFNYYRGREPRHRSMQTLVETYQSLYEAHGYTLPTLVYWNVRASGCGMFQEGKDGNCCMVSGYSASLFEAVIRGTEYVEEVNKDTGETVVRAKISPLEVMNKTLYSERYNRVYTGKKCYYDDTKGLKPCESSALDCSSCDYYE